MAQLISSNQKNGHRFIVTQTEAVKLLPALDRLKAGEVQDLDIVSANSHHLHVRIGGNDNVYRTESFALAANAAGADTNIIVQIPKHSFVRLVNVLREWGRSKATFDVSACAVPGTPPVQFATP